jgi:hypothetical protein
MPCNLDVICYIDQYNEVARKSNFVVNAVGIVNSRHQKVNIYVHIVVFYPKDDIRDNDLEKFNKGDIIKVQGRFSIVETEVEANKIKVIKVKTINQLVFSFLYIFLLNNSFFIY